MSPLLKIDPNKDKKEKMRKKMGDLAQGLYPLCSGTAALNTFFMTTEEHTTEDVCHVLKKLINNILNGLDDEQAPATLQDLNNNVFVHGFRVGYREAYKQWGEEVEDRLDEAYQAGITDECKQWKGKQMNTKPHDAPTSTTTTIETAAQTNKPPEHQCMAIQTESMTREMTHSSTQTSTSTVDSLTQTTPLDKAMSPLMMHAQPPSATSILPSIIDNHHHHYIHCFKPAPNTLKTTAHVAEPIHSPPAHSPAPSLEP
jgi:hypothetical protein